MQEWELMHTTVYADAKVAFTVYRMTRCGTILPL